MVVPAAGPGQETAAWAGGGAGLQLYVPRAPRFHNCPSSWASALEVLLEVPVLVAAQLPVTWPRALVDGRAMGAGLALALPGPGRATSRQGAGGGSRTLCPGQQVFRDAAEPSRLCTSPWKPYFVAASLARPAASSREPAAADSSLLPSAATRAALPQPPRPQLSAPWQRPGSRATLLLHLHPQGAVMCQPLAVVTPAHHGRSLWVLHQQAASCLGCACPAQCRVLR